MTFRSTMEESWLLFFIFGNEKFCAEIFFVMTLRWQLFENFLSRVGRGEKSFVLDWKAGIRIKNLSESRKKLRLKIDRRRFDACKLIIQKLQMDFSGTKKFLAGWHFGEILHQHWKSKAKLSWNPGLWWINSVMNCNLKLTKFTCMYGTSSKQCLIEDWKKS